MTFDPFGDFETRGYLRNFEKAHRMGCACETHPLRKTDIDGYRSAPPIYGLRADMKEAAN
jgi:hypothetical protein